jgi:hypothetical protein
MPFLAQCVFCNHQVQVPDAALGASGRCPKCSNFFTLAPATNLPPVKESLFARGKGPPPVAPELAVPSAVTEALAQPALRPRLLATAPAQAGAPAPAPLEIVGADLGPQKPRSWLEPLGLAALLLTGAALLCATVPRPWTLNETLCVVVMPAGVLGLLAGLAGLARSLTSGRFHVLAAAAGAAAAAALLLVAWQVPAALGPDYLAFRAQGAVNTNAVRVIPLSGRSADIEGLSPDWVDASRAALQQGPVRLEVASVTVGPLESHAGGKKKGPVEKYLVVRLRAHRVDGAADFAAQQAEAGRTSVPRSERPAISLTDNTGKGYPEQALAPGRDGSGETRQSSIFPVAVADEVYVFEPPPAGVESLRLEVPAAAWGGTATFRFTIPSAMIRPAPAAAGTRTGS